MSDKLSLPKSSYDHLTKIIESYSHGGDMTLDDLANVVGINRYRISSNHKFLIELGLITGGSKKSATSLGKDLGYALEHDQKDDIRLAWQEAIKGNAMMSDLIANVRIRKGRSIDEFLSHILYIARQKNNPDNRAGARTISDILVVSGLLEEQDGQLKVAEPIDEVNDASEISDMSSEAGVEETNNEQEPPDEERTPPPLNTPTVAINIQLQIPETENADVYENLFKALRKHLLNPDE